MELTHLDAHQSVVLDTCYRPHHLSDAKYDDVVVLRQIRLPKIHAFEGRQAKHTRPERPIPVR